jgi:glycosyltransferase involved in cell wall biosynthesis
MADDLKGLNVISFTTGHPCSDGRIYYKEAKTLAKFGASVTVLAPNIAKIPEQPLGENVTFKLFDIKKGLKNRFIHGHKIYRSLLNTDGDLIHCHEPDGLFWALLIKRKRPNLKIIFDSHEMWGADLAKRLPPMLWNSSQKGYELFESNMIRECDGAFGASLAISNYLSHHLPHNNLATIFNVPTKVAFPELEPAKLQEPIILLHEGSLSFNRGLKNMAMAVNELKNDYNIKLKIVGDVFGEEKAWLEKYIKNHKLENIIQRTGWLPYEKVGPEIASGHIGLNCHEYNPLNAIAAPNKCFNYMYYGLAQVAPDFPKSHYAILAKEGALESFKADNYKSMLEAIKKYLNNYSLLEKARQTALKLSKEKYRWEHMEKPLLDVYRHALR